eukprot:CAMPEP_0178442398 /NCGR_PEP_ID=MMETSP0689_2-20121128/38125_1 /TAXON_ID=160604 /ORGANISM="Amphidinium massartii, Strain CS-259" /LENGTH=95 /DNA_ID=CAMNT_0020065905 /DNA_START=69 /DNA_END=356 /DNA_ORIENTATION=-
MASADWFSIAVPIGVEHHIFKHEEAPQVNRPKTVIDEVEELQSEIQNAATAAASLVGKLWNSRLSVDDVIEICAPAVANVASCPRKSDMRIKKGL